jgi:N6-adenosine-specific RNA methylase IME4
MIVTSPFPLYGPCNQRFSLILADPAWAYDDALRNGGRGAVHNYAVHEVEAMARLDVEAIVADDAMIAMWAVPPQLPAAIDLMRAWGFEYLTVGFTWVKLAAGVDQQRNAVAAALRAAGVSRDVAAVALDAASPWLRGAPRMLMGRQTRQNAEQCLLGRRGAGLPRLDAGVSSVVFSPVLKPHSRKPDEVHRRLERLYGLECPRLEMFARRPMPGWAVWGNEILDQRGEPVRPTVTIPLRA